MLFVNMDALIIQARAAADGWRAGRAATGERRFSDLLMRDCLLQGQKNERLYTIYFGQCPRKVTGA